MLPTQTFHAHPLFKRTLPIAAKLALAICADANDLDVVRDAGNSTPKLVDFGHSYAIKAPGVGYGNRQVHRTFWKRNRLVAARRISASRQRRSFRPCAS